MHDVSLKRLSLYGLTPTAYNLHLSNTIKFAFIMHIWYNILDVEKVPSGSPLGGET